MATINGTTGNDNLLGGVGDDIITGNAGDDTLNGGGGNNTLNGGAGNDNYYIGATDTIIDSAGIDTVYLNIGYQVAGNTIDMRTFGGGKIENLDAFYYQAVNNTELTIIGNSASNTIGGSRDNTILLRNDIDGGAGDDTLFGGTQADTLVGGLGNDFLNGGNDTISDNLAGGKGDDTYFYRNETEDIIYEAAGEGIDTIELDSTFSILDMRSPMYNNIENINGSDDPDGVVLFGNSLANKITGGSGNDLLDGSSDSKKDILIGGEGGDEYLIHDLKDTIIETGTTGGDLDKISLDADFDNNTNTTDTTSYTLSDTKIEELDASRYDSNLILKGNAKTETIIIGGDGNDSITGGTASDELIGNAGDDTLFGGNDTLTDGLLGDDGNDTYVLIDTNDIINDDVGANTIQLMSSFKGDSLDLTEMGDYNYTFATAAISVIDATDVSKGLTLTANATIATTINGGKGKDTIIGLGGDDILYGNCGNDSISGGDGNDLITGGTGNDTINGGNGISWLYGDAGNDYLISGDGDDELYGGDGNDTLQGGTGSNRFWGGKGNDTYIFDGTETLTPTTITEFLNEGIDTVKLTSNFSGGSASIADYDNVENLDASELTGNITLTGNSLANTITGGGGDDTIYGGLGGDKMIGGLGDDAYHIDSYKDTVIESKNHFYDTIYIEDYNFGNTKSYTLAENVEALDLNSLDLDLTAAEKISFAKNRFVFNGNSSDNRIEVDGEIGDYLKISGGAGNDSISSGGGNEVIDGGSGDDTINSWHGNDTLTGGTGADTYQFAENDGNDFITATDATDIIDITTGTGIGTHFDFLFYTDKKGNFYIDYTDGGAGDDVIEIAKGKYNNSTIIQLGNEYIDVKTVLELMGSYANLSDTEIANINFVGDKANQADVMTTANWNNK